MNPADTTVVLGFFSIMAGIGVYFGRRMKTAGDYFHGGGGIPWWLAGVSFYMSTFSALAFVVYSALAYQYGFVAVTISWVTVPALLLGVFVFASRWRRVGKNSPLEYLESRYGSSVRQMIVWLGLGGRVLDDGLKLFALGTLLSVGMGVPITWTIVGSVAVILIYTVLGGLWAAVVADFVQFGIILSATISLAFIAGMQISPSDFIAQAPSGFFLLTSEKYGMKYIFVFLLLIIFSYTTNWPLIQRYAAVRSDQEARKVGCLVALLSLIGPPLYYAPAMIARVLFPEVADPNTIYAVICRKLLPAGLFGLVLAAMFSGSMSSLAGSFNSAAQVLTRDVYARLFCRTAPSAKRMMIAGRIFTFTLGSIAAGLAFYFHMSTGKNTDLFEIMASIFGFFIPPIALTMMLGLLVPRLSHYGAMAGLISGLVAGIVTYLCGFAVPVLRQAEWLTFSTTSATLLAMALGSWRRPGTEDTIRRVAEFVQGLRKPEFSQPATKDENSEVLKTIFLPIGTAFVLQGIFLLCAVLIFPSSGQMITSAIMAAFAFIFIGMIALFSVLIRHAKTARK
jgi:SSS family transporter